MKEKIFCFYGAGIVAATAYTAIKKLYNSLPKAFYVSDTRWNPTQIDGIPVLGADKIDASDKTCKYIIATPEVHHGAIADSLSQMGVSSEQMIFVDNSLENWLIEDYCRASDEFVTFSEVAVDSMSEKCAVSSVETESDATSFSTKCDIAVFQAKCHVDKPLQYAGEMPTYIQPIQVGAALTDIVIADVRDNNADDNISHKNRNYCELTATYYAWKNCHAQYKGLCHYRRIFDISDEKLRAMLVAHDDVDVILPYPTIHYPDIKSQHAFCVSTHDWNAMLQAVKEVAPEYYEAYEEVFSEKYFYNYNMLIAKREVFDDYCRFMFSVLECAEELTSPKGSERADRFAGYMAENMTTLYFRMNRDKLKIVHAGKLWFT